MKRSGVNHDRLGVKQNLDPFLEVDTFILRKLNCLCGNLPHTLQIIEDLKNKTSTLKPWTLVIDAARPAGKLIINSFCSPSSIRKRKTY